MKIKFLIILLFLLNCNAYANNCTNYFNNKKIDIETYFSQVLKENESAIEAIHKFRFYENSETMDPYRVSIQMLGFLKNSKSLNEKIPDFLMDLNEALSNHALDVVATRGLIVETLLVQSAVNARKAVSGKNETNGNVTVLGAGSVNANKRYHIYLEAIYTEVKKYFDSKHISIEARESRIDFLLMGDHRYARMDTPQRTAFIHELKFFILQGQDAKATADTYFLRN